MSKLVPCKGCKHLVHPTAKTCPQCGVANPGKDLKTGCMGLIVLFSIIVFWALPDKSQQNNDALKTPAVQRAERVRKGFNPWNGEPIQLTELIKKAMKNPDSYQHVETIYSEKGDVLIVHTTYRGTNSFGAVVPNTVTAETDLDGNVLKVYDQ